MQCKLNGIILILEILLQKLILQSLPFKARDRARAPPHAPCFVEVRDKHAPKKMFTLLRAPGNRTVCKKGRIILFLFSK